MKRIIFVGLAIAALSFAVTGTADASCSVTGEIVRVQASPGPNYTYVFLRSSSIGLTIWRAFTNDSKIASMAAAVVPSRNRVQIIGNIASCPAAATGIVDIGLIESFVLYP
jgi:hypothetical protein